jgi:hypothetical protein
MHITRSAPSWMGNPSFSRVEQLRFDSVNPDRPAVRMALRIPRWSCVITGAIREKGAVVKVMLSGLRFPSQP